MKEITIYEVIWDNGHASGVFPDKFTSLRDAERFGASWKREMVAIDPDPKDRKAAREAYQWEVVENTFYVHRESELGGGSSWWVYITPSTLGKSPILKACPHRQVVPSIIDWLNGK